MKRKKMEKEVVHLLEWIIEYPGVWQIVCNPDGKETSPESFKMAYDMLVKKSLFYLIPVLFATHPGEESLEMAKNLCTADSAAREIRKNGMGALVKCIPAICDFRITETLWIRNVTQYQIQCIRTCFRIFSKW